MTTASVNLFAQASRVRQALGGVQRDFFAVLAPHFGAAYTAVLCILKIHF
jgi:hypothetical protein